MTPQKTTVDWFRFRAKAEPQNIIDSMRPLFPEPERDWLNLKALDRGILGFQQGSEIRLADMVVGRMDFGGESQKGWVRVDLQGKGCEWVKNWDDVDCIEELPSAEIRRLDIALTTWRGEVGHDRVVRAHEAGRFVTRGRPPHLKQRISSDPRAGKTCEIGEREKTDKFMRCYEKGFQLVAKYGNRLPGLCTAIDGFPVQDIYRCEVELKAVSKDIPFEVIERRDQYFAGSYPFCADILPDVDCDILQRRPERESKAELLIALENCRVQFGPTLYTALRAYHGDIGAVWDKVIGDHHSQTLLEAGVLLVEHE
jgi:DNA relaxase NicK